MRQRNYNDTAWHVPAIPSLVGRTVVAPVVLAALVDDAIDLLFFYSLEKPN